MFHIAIPIILAGIVAMYRYLLPKPIPGDIPYDKLSQKRLMGDLPDMLRSTKITKDPIDFLCDQVLKHQSPIVQVWIKPFQKPIVVLSDPLETEDILLRRTKEFDRAPSSKDLLASTIPHHHVVLPTNEQFKAQRKFISDAMSPAFLRDIAAPRIRDTALELVELWRLKARIAAGRPFSARNDIRSAIFDAIWVIAIGDKVGGISTQINFLSEHQSSTTLKLKDDAVIFPVAAPPSIVLAINQIVEAFEQVSKSPIPQLHHRILKWFPTLHAAYATKDEALDRMLKHSRQCFQDSEKQTRSSALDYFLHRDNQHLEKIGAHLSEPVIRDELFGFLLAGHDTTSTTLAWIAKYLTTHSGAQQKLRTCLNAAFPKSKSPDASDVLQTPLPYLDAFIAESLRTGQTTSSLVRAAEVDTQILGNTIPAGTEVYMVNGGAGYLRPPLSIPDSVRSERSRGKENSSKAEKWDFETLGEFLPERWIDTAGEFDPRAGPLHTFGLGVRACWGRKLAWLQMRVVVALLVVAFEFEAVPEPLAGFEGVLKMTHEPKVCYIRLKELVGSNE